MGEHDRIYTSLYGFLKRWELEFIEMLDVAIDRGDSTM